MSCTCSRILFWFKLGMGLSGVPTGAADTADAAASRIKGTYRIEK